MFNSIFKKQFVYFFSILLLSFTMLGVSLSLIFKNYFVEKKKEILSKEGTYISELFETAYVSLNDNNKTVKDFLPKVSDELTNMARFLNISYVVTDEKFAVVGASYDVIKNPDLPIIVGEYDDIKSKRPITFEGDLNGFFSEKKLTVAYPIVFDNTLKGAIFLNSSINEIESNVSEISRIMLVTILISGGFIFIAIYVFSKTLVKPLYKMSEIAKDISLGDFEKRVEIYSKDEIGRLGESLNAMAENLQKQEVQRRNFVANISHDLRSPLTSINGFLFAMIDGTVTQDKQERYLRIILEETERLAKLANDILDINKVEIVELQPSIFNINEVIRKTVIQFENRILDKNITLKVTFQKENEWVHADIEKIQRVVHNLLDNAIKFTNENGKILIATFIKDNKIYIKIKDDGIGLSKEDQMHVFDRFFKADTSRGVDKKGTGLGLSIIKEFIKAHSENIYLSSELGVGTEIIFTLMQATNDKK